MTKVHTLGRLQALDWFKQVFVKVTPGQVNLFSRRQSKSAIKLWDRWDVGCYSLRALVCPFYAFFPYFLINLMFLLLTKSVHFMHDYSWINNKKLSREKICMLKEHVKIG